MASDEIELIRWAFERLDSTHYESVLAVVDDEFEMTTTAAVASEPDTYRGRAGVRRWWESFLDAMSGSASRRLGSPSWGAARRSSSSRIHAGGKQSGIEVKQPSIGLATVSDSKLSRLEFFLSVEEARAAARSTPG